MAQLQYSSIFGELTKMVQIRFDKVSEQNKKLFDNVLFEQYLDWDTPTIKLDFEEAIGKYNISLTAATIGDNSNEPVIGTEGMATLKERILNHALAKSLTAQEYRQIRELQASTLLTPQQRKEALIELMWGKVTDVVTAVLNKIDLIFLRGLSNKGVCELNAENNPEGGVRGTIDYKQPSGNIATAALAWTDDNAKTVDCFEDIQAILDAAQDKVTFDRVLCSPSLIYYICRTSAMKKMIWGSDKSSTPVLPSKLNEFMQSNDMPVFVPVRRQMRIQNGTDITTYSPWNGSNLVFLPKTDNGKIGVVKNAFADSELEGGAEPDITYSNYGRIRVSQWKTGEKQNSRSVEFTKAQCYALPVITEMNGIYTLDTGRTV